MTLQRQVGIWLAALQNWRASSRAQADATH